jgi:hypothetical protein
MRWATRAGVHVDRAACAWLIRRFIDPDAEFVFLGNPTEVPADATPFDMRGAALGHHQGRCSFETALASYGLDTDPALEEIGRIVHEADLADDRFDAPAAVGLDVLIRGLTLTGSSDDATLAITGRLFDGLYEHTRRQLMTGRPPDGSPPGPAAFSYRAGSVCAANSNHILLRGHPVKLDRVRVAEHQVEHPPAVDIEPVVGQLLAADLVVHQPWPMRAARADTLGL